MPDSITKRALVHAAAPAANVVGLDQGWAVYAPTPRGVSTYLEARVIDRDGTTRSYPVPMPAGLAEYWDYRWQRYADTLLNGPGQPRPLGPVRPVGGRRGPGRRPLPRSRDTREHLRGDPAAGRPRAPEPVDRAPFFSIGVN